jgi:hypothetical protein
MTFKNTPNPTFWATVEIPMPGGEPQPLEIEFRHKRKSEGIELIERMRTGEIGIIDVLRELVAGWRGAEREFSDAELVELDENFIGAADAIFSAYPEALRGARRKN